MTSTSEDNLSEEINFWNGLVRTFERKVYMEFKPKDPANNAKAQQVGESVCARTIPINPVERILTTDASDEEYENAVDNELSWNE